MIFSDKGRRGGKPISDFWLTRGGGGVSTPHFLADIIYERPLMFSLVYLYLQFLERKKKKKILYAKTAFGIDFKPWKVPRLRNMHFHFHPISGWGTEVQNPFLNIS